jgi:hypothetical protein
MGTKDRVPKGDDLGSNAPKNEPARAGGVRAEG